MSKYEPMAASIDDKEESTLYAAKFNLKIRLDPITQVADVHPSGPVKHNTGKKRGMIMHY